MTYRPRAACKRCGVRRDSGVHISRGGNCPGCGAAAQLDNMADLHSHSGPYWLHYLDGLTAAVARLWGETVPPGEILAATDQDPRSQETSCQAG